MYLIHEDLARAHIRQRLSEAREYRRVTRVLQARKGRKAEHRAAQAHRR
jgi:hypothetical protein